MDLSMKWLNDYVKADMPIKEFCDGMTMSGSKVETWTKQGADITNVVVGMCVAMEKHPDADTLWVCQIDVGKDAPVQEEEDDEDYDDEIWRVCWNQKGAEQFF